MNRFKETSTKSKKRLQKAKLVNVRKYLHAVGYLSSTLTLPEYYRASGFDKMNLEKISYKRGASQVPRRTKPIKLITPKGKMAWRQFGLMHPYSYWHICEEMTEQENWQKIVDLLTEETGISSYSLPPVYTMQNPQGAGIKAWKKLSQRDLIIDLSNKTYCASTDISNFYPSIYTHSIAWATEGKMEAREDRNKQLLLGSHLDKLFQNSRDGQTNGILIGSILSDIVAELVLARIDKDLMESIEKNNLNLVVVRYRDDYKFLCKTKSDAELALRIFSKVIQTEFDLTINEKKTHVDDDIVLGALRPWDLEFKSSYILAKVFDSKFRDFTAPILIDVLLAAYELQAKYPESRAGISVINRLAKKIEHNKKFKISSEAAEVIIPLVRKFILLREDVTPHAMLLIDQMLRFIEPKRRPELIRDLCDQYLGSEDNAYQEVWLYRVCLHHSPELIDELFGSSTNQLILVLTTKEPHYTFFETNDTLSSNDKKELEKFSLIDQSALSHAAGEPITPKTIDLFTY
jgi:hypothetical protein